VAAEAAEEAAKVSDGGRGVEVSAEAAAEAAAKAVWRLWLKL
jgi:hypothetical protein